MAVEAWMGERGNGESKGNDPEFVRYDTFRNPKAPSHARVTMKAAPAVKQLEVRMCHRGVEHVFINMVARTGVNVQNVVFEMAVRQAPQPFQPLLSYHLNRPTNHRRRVIVEPFENFRVGARAIVISDQGEPFTPDHFIDASLGVAAVTDNIAQT